MQRRPSGVTLSAVVLGLMSLLLFIAGLVDIILAVLFGRTAGQPAAPPHLMVVAFGIMALLTLACTAWGFSTTSALLRMQHWARHSIMTIAGCLAVFSLLEIVGCITVQMSMKSLALPADSSSAALVTTNPDAMQGSLFFVEALFVGATAIGIWWLVYFAQQRIRKVFELARPDARQTSGASERPISMTIVAVLLLLSSLSLLLFCLVPVPLFFFGVQVSGGSAYAVLISFAALNALAGFGLLRKMHLGWLLAVGVHILGLLNLLTLLLSAPVRERWIAYTRDMATSMLPATPNAASVASQLLRKNVMSEMMVYGLMLGFAYAALMLVLLWRARWCYKTGK